MLFNEYQSDREYFIKHLPSLMKYINQKIYDHLEFLINGASWKLNGYAESISLNKGIIDE